MMALKVLSYNIQVAVGTQTYHHYVTRSWRHLLPYSQRRRILDEVAGVLSPFDIVCLQEIDAGSYRSEFTNQAEYLAASAGFGSWHLQVNRNFSVAAQHGIALLSKIPFSHVEEHDLPGILPGRGALLCRLQRGDGQLTVIGVHLGLSAQARRRQLDYLARLAKPEPRVIMLGDFNCHLDELERHGGLHAAGLRPAFAGTHTYPSWRPQRALDHILVSGGIVVRDTMVLAHTHSDHLPIASELEL